jgi:hypothetical protein
MSNQDESGNETSSIEVELGDGSTTPASQIPFDAPIQIIPFLKIMQLGHGTAADAECGVVGCDETNPRRIIGVAGPHNGMYCQKHVQAIFGARSSGAFHA